MPSPVLQHACTGLYRLQGPLRTDIRFPQLIMVDRQAVEADLFGVRAP